MILFMKIKSFDFVKIIAPDKPASSSCSCFFLRATHYYIPPNEAGHPKERPRVRKETEECFCRESIKRIRITPRDFPKKEHWCKWLAKCCFSFITNRHHYHHHQCLRCSSCCWSSSRRRRFAHPEKGSRKRPPRNSLSKEDSLWCTEWPTIARYSGE